MKKSLLTMAAALTFSLCASAQTQYVMQIKKTNGDVVRMNADEVEGITFESAALSDRTALIEHVRAIAKGLAEQGVNMEARSLNKKLANEFAKVFVNNIEFFKGIRDASVAEAARSAKDVEAGSELEQGGYTKYVEWSIDKLFGRYTFKNDGAPVVEQANQVEIIFPITIEDKGTTDCMTTIKGTGNMVKMVFRMPKNPTTALVLQLPETFVVESGSLSNGTFTKVFDTALTNNFEANGASQYVSFLGNKWTMNGVKHSYMEGTEDFPKPDVNVITYGLGFDPVATGQMTSEFGFDQNGHPVFDWRGSVTVPTLPAIISNLSALIAALRQSADSGDSSFNISDILSGLSSISIADLIMPLLAGSTIDNMESVLMDDLGFKIKVTDIPQLVTVLSQLREARHQHKGEAEIDALVQQLNAVTEGAVSCKALSQELPFKMVTEKFGIGYIPAPAVKFADEEDYVPFSELVDKETIKYTLNFLSGGVPEVAANARTMVETFLIFMQLINFDKDE